MVALNWNGITKGPHDLGSSSLGTAWGNIGSAFAASGARSISIFTGLDIGSSNNSRARLVGRVTAAGSAYALARQRDSGTATGRILVDQYYQYSDSDQRQMLSWELLGSVPFVQFQGQVGTVGTPAAVLEAQAFTSI